MGAMASQITGFSIVYSTACSGADKKNHQSSASLAFVRGIHRRPAQRASNAGNVSIWWRHHDNPNRAKCIPRITRIQASRNEVYISCKLMDEHKTRDTTYSLIFLFSEFWCYLINIEWRLGRYTCHFRNENWWLVPFISSLVLLMFLLVEKTERDMGLIMLNVHSDIPSTPTYHGKRYWFI